MTSSPSLSLPFQTASSPVFYKFSLSRAESVTTKTEGSAELGRGGSNGGQRHSLTWSWGQWYLQQVAADSGGHQHGDDHSAMEEMPGRDGWNKHPQKAWPGPKQVLVLAPF